MKTGSVGLVDTYTITYSDGTTSTFTVTNGKDGSADIVTAWETTPSDEKVPSEKLVKDTLDGKVDKETGKGLFSGSYTDLTNKPTIPEGSSTATDIQMDGTQSAGSSTKYAKADHVHPTDTSRAASSHTHSAGDVTDSNAHSNIGTSANATQAQINTAIDTMIGQAIQYIQQ